MDNPQMPLLGSRLPLLVVPEKVIKQMVEETLNHPPTETGQSLIGLEPTDSLIIVLGTIPDILDTLRQPGLFSLGGQDQVEIFRWFKKHWAAMQQSSAGMEPPSWQLGQQIPRGFIPRELNQPLKVVGEWHRHPGNYKDPSIQDRATMLSILVDPAQKRRQFVAPIAVYDPGIKLVWGFSGQELVVTQLAGEIRINWYYVNRNHPLEMFQLTPLIVPNDQLPWLPPIAWHLTDIVRMRTELALLKDAGYQVRWTVKEVEGDSHIQEVVFGIDHPTWKKRILLITQWDYPKSRPSIRLLDKESVEQEVKPVVGKRRSRIQDLLVWLRNIVSQPNPDLWNHLTPVTRWGKTVYLVDMVRELESQVKGEEYDSESSSAQTEPGSGDSPDRPESS